MPLLDHFSIIAPFYDQFARVKETSGLRRRLALPAAGRLLDAGGGTGRVSQAVSDAVDQVVIVDLSQGMLRQAKEKAGLHPVVAPAERLPFPQASFERILMVDALHHVYNQAQTTADLWRVLKPGGRLVLEEPDIRTWPVKLVALGEKILLMRSHFLSPAHIADLFSYPNARVTVENEQYNAWVIVEKLA